MKKAILFGLSLVTAVLNTACAHPHYYEPRAYQPQPTTYYSQPPIYYTPPPPPVYCTPPPVYYTQPAYCAPRPYYSVPVYYGPSIGLGFGFNHGRSFIGFNIR
jgi:hypothetical protein